MLDGLDFDLTGRLLSDLRKQYLVVWVFIGCIASW